MRLSRSSAGNQHKQWPFLIDIELPRAGARPLLANPSQGPTPREGIAPAHAKDAAQPGQPPKPGAMRYVPQHQRPARSETSLDSMGRTTTARHLESSQKCDPEIEQGAWQLVTGSKWSCKKKKRSADFQHATSVCPSMMSATVQATTQTTSAPQWAQLKRSPQRPSI